MSYIIYCFIKFSLWIHRILKSSFSGKTEFVNDAYGQDLANYNFEVVRDYTADYQVVAPSHEIKNLNILEIGTGKSLGVAALLAIRGNHVVTLDRFKHVEEPCEELEDFCSREQVKFEQVAKNQFLVGSGSVTYFVCPLESRVSAFKEKFDLVLSRATLEHIENVGTCLQNLYFYSKKGARHVHEIDHRDHGLFSHFKFCSNMWFHNIPSEVWEKVVIQIPGLPNKINSEKYRELFRNFGFLEEAYKLKFPNEESVSIHSLYKE
jgi:hypothetical protein